MMFATQGAKGTLPEPTPDLDGKDTVEPVPMPEVEGSEVQDAASMIAEFVYPDDCSPLKWSPFRHLCPTATESGDTFTGDTFTGDTQPQDPAPDFIEV